MYNWLLANKISLNCTKTELIYFHKPNDVIPGEIKIKLNGKILIPTNSIKYLGIYLDETLSGKSHFDVLSKKLYMANSMLAKYCNFVREEELKSIYYAIFSSHLTYGSQIWGQNNDKYMKNIIGAGCYYTKKYYYYYFIILKTTYNNIINKYY